MGLKSGAAVALLAVVILSAATTMAKKKDNEEICTKGWECKESNYCCNLTISDFFQPYQFEALFSRRNDPVAHAVGFWDYQSFITASTFFQPHGFCTTGGREMQMRELAAFLGHVGAKTSCGYEEAPGGPLAWGLCYNHEMSPTQSYCADNLKYPCVDGVGYYGRGAIPCYWNHNYGWVGEGIKVDLLNHPEYLEQNATLAFQAAMYMWMNSQHPRKPSAHDVFVCNWKPTKNDTAENRLCGFGATMNVLYGDQLCGHGYIESMNTTISHYQYYLDLMGVGREHSGENLDCAKQKAFNPSAPSTSSSS